MLGAPLPFQVIDEVLALFGPTPAAARIELLDWMRRGDPDYAHRLTASGRWEDERNIERNVIGTDAFTVRVIEQAERAASRRIRRRAQGWDLDRVISRVCDAVGTSRAQVLDATRRPRAVSDARTIIIGIATRELGLAQATLARALGLGKSAVGHALERCDRLVEDPAFRAWHDAAALPPG